jgi:hypothetical protein
MLRAYIEVEGDGAYVGLMGVPFDDDLVRRPFLAWHGEEFEEGWVEISNRDFIDFYSDPDTGDIFIDTDAKMQLLKELYAKTETADGGCCMAPVLRKSDTWGWCNRFALREQPEGAFFSLCDRHSNAEHPGYKLMPVHVQVEGEGAHVGLVGVSDHDTVIDRRPFLAWHGEEFDDEWAEVSEPVIKMLCWIEVAKESFCDTEDRMLVLRDLYARTETTDGGYCMVPVRRGKYTWGCCSAYAPRV